MILPGLAFTTSSREAAFTFSTTSLLEMLVMGKPKYRGPLATCLNACAHTQAGCCVQDWLVPQTAKLAVKAHA